MTDQVKWDFINQLGEDFIKGGVMLSKWFTLLIRDADVAFTTGANLAALLTALAGIESHLKYEYSEKKRECHIVMIDKAPIDEGLRLNLHRLRIYRNTWVHVDDPSDDETFLPELWKHEREFEGMAILAIKSLRRTICNEQWT